MSDRVHTDNEQVRKAWQRPATYTIRCPACGKVETLNDRQGYIIIVSKNGLEPRTYGVCSECRQDMFDLLEGRGEERIERMAHEQEERIPTSVWGHHE